MSRTALQKIVLPPLASLLVVGPILFVLWMADRAHQEQYLSTYRLAAQHELAGKSGRLESAVHARLGLLSGLVAYVALKPGVDEAELAAYARGLMEHGGGVRGVQLARDGVVSHVFPPDRELGERGIRLEDLARQREGVRQALRSREAVVAGPVDLRGGRQAFVYRAAVHLTPPGGEPYSGELWGLAGIFVDADALLREADFSDGPQALRYAVRGRDGLGFMGGVFHGDAGVFALNPVVATVHLPNGLWQVGAAPIGGWEPPAPGTPQLRLTGSLIALLTGMLIWFLVRNRIALGQEFKERQQVAAALRQSESMLATLMRNLPGMAFRCRGDRLGAMQFASQACLDLTGYGAEELQEGGSLRYGDIVHPEDREKILQAVQQALASGATYEVVYRILTKAGETRWVWEQGTGVDGDGGGPGVIGGFVADMTERKRLEDNLVVLSQQDGLTQIANRRFFEERLRVEWGRAERNRTSLSLVMADIDYFKPYNDTYGHQVGDDCLEAIAHALEGCLKRPADFVARYGGEEFVAVLPETNKRGALNVAERFRQAVQELAIPHAAADSGHVTISLGVGVCRPRPGMAQRSLVEVADRALYQAKNEGRNRTVADSLDAPVEPQPNPAQAGGAQAPPPTDAEGGTA